MNETKHYRINELFLSLQGEGYHTGQAAVFVRFSGCNLHCTFCDTEHSSYQLMTAQEISKAIQQLSLCTSTLIVLTGGEPALQIDEPLLHELHTTGKTICVETNGTSALPKGIDWITCSPKEGTLPILTQAHELKIVFQGQDVEQWTRKITAQHLFLQPCSCQNTQDVIRYIIAHPWWRLSLQTHKYLSIR